MSWFAHPFYPFTMTEEDLKEIAQSWPVLLYYQEIQFPDRRTVDFIRSNRMVQQQSGFQWRKSLRSLRGMIALFFVGILLSLSVSSCGIGIAAGQNRTVEVTLVSFAVTKAAHAEIIPKFVEKWQREHNQTVTFNQSYGGSGTQTRAVIDGLEADIVHLALGLDVQKIEKAGLIQAGWEKEAPNNGIVTQSVSAIVTREGNPKNIRNWSDLANNGVQVITADPRTSGVARWNFLALWNAAIKSNNDPKNAEEFVTRVYQNVPILARDAREASDAFFKQGQGDALINYENEIVLASQKGLTLPYTVPDVNISIDNPIAIVDSNVDKHGNRDVVEAFIQYLYSREAQAEFAKAGFRPVDATVAQTKEFSEKFPNINKLATVKEYGGWKTIQKQFFDDDAMFDRIQNAKKYNKVFNLFSSILL